MILADKIANLRKRQGWSQEELAHQLGVSRQSVSKWESGGSIPDLEKILKLADLFEVSTDVLLRDDLEPEQFSRERESLSSVMETDAPAPVFKCISLEEANTYLDTVRYVASKIALGVALCILSPVAILHLGGLSSEEGGFVITDALAAGAGTIVLLVLVAVAVSLFLFFGSRLSPYEYLDSQPVELAYGVHGVVEKKWNSYQPTHLLSLVTGVALCILSLVPLMVGIAIDEDGMAVIVGLEVMFLVVAIGVFLMVRTCYIAGAFQRLLETGEFTREQKQWIIEATQKAKGEWKTPVANIYWGLAMAIYLAWSFITEDWERTWILWPVVAVLYFPVRSIVGLLQRNK